MVGLCYVVQLHEDEFTMVPDTFNDHFTNQGMNEIKYEQNTVDNMHTVLFFLESKEYRYRLEYYRIVSLSLI